MPNNKSLSMRLVLDTWWPLAASWLFMAAELPAMSIVVARLADPKINLAAFGAIVFPVALIIESPVIMLLSASTTLSRDAASYLKMRRFMMWLSALLTSLHMLVAFTPLYFLVVEQVLGAPPEVIGPARIGLMVTTPWTWAIAYRRFNQGVLIRFGYSRTITIGTFIRLTIDSLVLAAGYWLHSVPGVVVASVAIACGVVAEAVYVGFQVQPVLNNELEKAPPVAEPITLRSFLRFYVPLAMTSLLILLTPLIVSMALSRMPLSLESLAAWPVVIGLIAMFRGLGLAYNEVVVALLDQPQAWQNLRRFARWLALSASALFCLIAVTPLSNFWFQYVIGLQPSLARMAELGLWIAVPIPILASWQSFFQGTLLYTRRTRAITEAVALYLLIFALLALTGVRWGRITGLYAGLVILLVSTSAQTAWLWVRSRPLLREIRERDPGSSLSLPA